MADLFALKIPGSGPYQVCPACGKGRSVARPEEGWLPIRTYAMATLAPLEGVARPSRWACLSCGASHEGLHLFAPVVCGVRYGVESISEPGDTGVSGNLDMVLCSDQLGAPDLIFDGSWDCVSPVFSTHYCSTAYAALLSWVQGVSRPTHAQEREGSASRVVRSLAATAERDERDISLDNLHQEVLVSLKNRVDFQLGAGLAQQVGDHLQERAR